ncbi:CAP domain-containing protein [Plantactinospora sp. WMMB334]|uniref:CAP domain-containing protein n=1 Tax=Plantactinospora sp. WMMB334 TaxID=3404119 RepID=UPI003B9589FA
MQGWSEEADWEDGADWPTPPAGHADPAGRAGYPDDPPPSRHARGERDERHRDERHRDERRGERDRDGERRAVAGHADRSGAYADRSGAYADLSDAYPGWSSVQSGGDDDERPDRAGAGRHRRPTSLRGPIGLGVAVTALLGVIGAGAALLPAGLTDAPAGTRGNESAVEAAGPEEPIDLATPEPADVDEETPGPTTTPTTTRTSPKPRVTTTAPKPARTSAPPARRTPGGSGSDPGPGSGSGASGAGSSSQETQVLTIVNRERAANGCAAVVINNDLAEAARLHSQDQAENTDMSHTGSDGSDFVERARRAGYDRPIGENVAMGYRDAAAVMEGWMNSSGHRANILNCDARAMGVGVATGPDGRLYWTQMFGSAA